MVIQITGRISFKDTPCEKCGAIISIWVYSPAIKCNSCGANYNLLSSELYDQSLKYEYEFGHFECIYSTLAESCKEICPSKRMYCKDHSNDKAIKYAENTIAYCQKSLTEAQDNLELIKESKRMWLIQELSGISNEDNSIQEN